MRARNGLVGRWRRPFASGVQPLPAMNKSASWRKGHAYGPAPDCAALPPVFFDPRHGILVFPSICSPDCGPGVGTLLVTSDGGLTWSARTLSGHVQPVVDFVDVGHG